MKKYSSDEEREASTRYSQIKSRANIDNWSREDFIAWYTKSLKKCHYCGCTEKEIKKFWILSKSKRKKTRGKSFEIDRKRDEDYSADNCVLACYWCNNAKSDVFSQEEFKPIGIAIGRVIRRLLS